MHPILLHKLPFLPVVHFSVGGKGDDTPTTQNYMYDIFQQKKPHWIRAVECLKYDRFY